MNVSLSLSLAALAALVGFIIWPSIKDIRSLNEVIENQQVELERLYIKGRSIKQTLEEYREVKPTVATLDNIYVKRGDELKLITTLEQVAHDQGVEQDLTQASPTDNRQGNTLQLQLHVVGSLPKLIKYLAALEALDYYLNVNLLRLNVNQTTAVSQTAGSPQLSAIFLTTAYLKP
jgi:hypothetical protein